MIALSYGITYIWGTVGIILICNTCRAGGASTPRRRPSSTRRSTASPAATTPALTG